MLILSIHNPSRSKRRSGEFCDLCIKCLGYGIIIIAHEKCNGQQFFKASPRSVVSCPYLSISLSAATGVLEFSFDILHDIFSLDLAMLFYFCSYVFSVACVNGWRWSIKVYLLVFCYGTNQFLCIDVNSHRVIIAWNNDYLIERREHTQCESAYLSWGLNFRLLLKKLITCAETWVFLAYKHVCFGQWKNT